MDTFQNDFSVPLRWALKIEGCASLSARPPAARSLREKYFSRKYDFREK
jgi:hypothetical protein